MPEDNVPDVTATDLTRAEMEEVAEECGIEAEGLDDQQLLERLGVALGEIEGSQVRSGVRRRRADGGDDGEQATSEQDLPGEPTEGPTRDELRDELRELGLPVAGTKEELQQRLAGARGDRDDEGARDESRARSDRLHQKVAERVADGLSSASERLRESVEDDDDNGDDAGAGGPSKLKRAGRTAWRKITPG